MKRLKEGLLQPVTMFVLVSPPLSVPALYAGIVDFCRELAIVHARAPYVNPHKRGPMIWVRHQNRRELHGVLPLVHRAQVCARPDLLILPRPDTPRLRRR